MNIEDARKEVGVSRKDVSDRLEIPYRTLSGWENKERSCPKYIEKLIVEKILKMKEVKIMNKNVFELKENSGEFSWKNRNEIEEGCTTGLADQDPVTLGRYETKEEALEALKKYETKVYKLSGAVGSYYSVTEYYVEENIYDEDGDLVDCGDIWEFSKMPEIED